MRMGRTGNTGTGTRVRFAPSPTGELHVGNARTALFNWLFAMHGGGELILRIEDTDRARTSEICEQHIIEDLKWLEIDWDEGPEKGGPLGPYHQSRRLDIYGRFLRRLMEENRVYPCYCTEEELERERAEMLSRGLAPRYRGRCRNLSAEDRKRLESEGRQPAYRFRIEAGAVEFEDLIRGPMRFDAADIGDFIVVRSAGIPAYNFAVVIDDHLMEISHVIRGEDHLSNTAMQLLLYRALGFDPPRFAHHSLILGKDRSKLSKRHGSVAVREFRKKGVLPEAMVNYLALLGSSYGEGKEVMTSEEIVRGFSLDRAGKSGAIFDEEKLEWLNAQYIRKCEHGHLTDLLLPYLKDEGFDTESRGRAWIEAVVQAVKGNLRLLSEVGRYADVFFDERFGIGEEARAVLAQGRATEVLRALEKALREDGCPEERPYACLMDRIKADTGLKGKALFLPVRAAVTGKTWGPELDRVCDLLGRGSLLMRAEKAREAVKK